MKICFIWVEKYRNFENLNLNLSSSTKYEFDEQKNVISKIKTPAQIKKLPQDFFGEKIEDVIGIIGKNGTGKSNALALVCKCVTMS